MDQAQFFAIREAALATTPAEVKGPLPSDPSVEVLLRLEYWTVEGSVVVTFEYAGTATNYTVQAMRETVYGPDGQEISRPEPVEGVA